MKTTENNCFLRTKQFRFFLQFFLVFLFELLSKTTRAVLIIQTIGLAVMWALVICLRHKVFVCFFLCVFSLTWSIANSPHPPRTCARVCTHQSGVQCISCDTTFFFVFFFKNCLYIFLVQIKVSTHFKQIRVFFFFRCHFGGMPHLGP